MQDSNIPLKFPIPFANNAGAGFIRDVPQDSQVGVQNGAASLFDGFPPNCFLPIAAGGSWPFAQDFNGLFKQITAWLQWQQAGGTVPYDAAFQAAIGGYPKGSIIASATTAGLFWLSATDNNVTNPDTGGTGWFRWPHTRNAEIVAADLSPLIFPSSLGSNGWKKYPDPNSPSGFFVEQWGTLTVNLSANVVFPIAFPNACMRMIVCEGAAGNTTWGIGSPTLYGAGTLTASFGVAWALGWDVPSKTWVGGTPITCAWMAKGY